MCQGFHSVHTLSIAISVSGLLNLSKPHHTGTERKEGGEKVQVQKINFMLQNEVVVTCMLLLEQ